MYARKRPEQDLEDLAYDFIEQELGRHAWQSNIAKARHEGTLLPRIRNWLDHLGIDASADRIAERLFQLTLNEPGRWR